EAGRQALEAEKVAVKAILARLSETGERGAGFSPRLIRAQHNLRAALKMKLMAGPLSAAQAEAIVAALDEAARQGGEAEVSHPRHPRTCCGDPSGNRMSRWMIAARAAITQSLEAHIDRPPEQVRW